MTLTVVVGGREVAGKDDELEEETSSEERDRQPVAPHLRRNLHRHRRRRTARPRAEKAKVSGGLRGDEGLALVKLFIFIIIKRRLYII